MAQERSVNTLELTEVEGKQYVVGPWPEKFIAHRGWLTTGLNPRTTKWENGKLNLWMENGSAVYTVGDDFDPQAPEATLHKMYGPDPGPVPGREEPPKLEQVPPEELNRRAEEVANAANKMGGDVRRPGQDGHLRREFDQPPHPP